MISTLRSADHLEVVYEVKGEGPGLILLHGGYTQDKSVWSSLSYVSELAKDFTVVLVDIRGHGQSSQPNSAEFYEINRIINDVEQIAQTVGLSDFSIWGFSLGASIALQCATQLPVKRVVAAGTFFGKALQLYARENSVGLREAISLNLSGKLKLSQLDIRDKHFMEQANLTVALAISDAMSHWPAIQPHDLKVPCYVYTGSQDEPVCSMLEDQAVDIRNAGILLTIYEGLNHSDLLLRKPIVFPAIKRFLFQ